VRKRGRGHEGGTEKGTAITARQDTSISQSASLTHSEWTHTHTHTHTDENSYTEMRARVSQGKTFLEL